MAIVSDTIRPAPAIDVVAPWWHLAVVLIILAIGSVASARQAGLPNLHLPGSSLRFSGYVTVLLEEWLLFLWIWFWLRQQRLPLRTLTGRRWQTPRAFLQDVGWSVLFLLVGIPLTSGLIRVLGVKSIPGDFLPHSYPELVVYLAMTATAGLCEELIFRGYLNQQFSRLTRSSVLGIGLQGIAFGLAHGYQGSRLIFVIILYGWLFGAFVAWRRSLLPAMLAHGLQDSLGGILFFASTK